MNLLEFIKMTVLRFTFNLNDNIVFFITRTGLWLFLVHIFICAGSAYIKPRTGFVLTMLIVIPTFLAFGMPLNWVEETRTPTALLILLICCLVMISTPRSIVLRITPVTHRQIRLMIIIYSIVWSLFALQLILIRK